MMTHPENTEWNDLLLKAKSGQVQAREELCRQLSVRLSMIVGYRLWGWSRQDHEDLVQESLCTLLQKLDRIESNPQLYACEILNHKIGHALRRRKHVKIPIVTDTGEDPESLLGASVTAQISQEDGEDFIAKLEAGNEVDLICKAIKQLSSFCRVAVMGLLEGKDLQELWATFKLAESSLQRGAFYKRLFDCRRKLKQLVRD